MLQNATMKVIFLLQALQQRGMTFGMKDSRQAHENLTVELEI